MSVETCTEPAKRDFALPAGRDAVLAFEQAVAKMPQVNFPLQHFFVDGVYIRQIFIKAGCVLVGYIHMMPCITTISAGAIAIADGESTTVLRAPHTMECPAGSKKAGYALEDTIWQDAYHNPTDERDIPTLEKLLTAGSHAEFLERVTLLENKS